MAFEKGGEVSASERGLQRAERIITGGWNEYLIIISRIRSLPKEGIGP
jgi:hypothetical protein